MRSGGSSHERPHRLGYLAIVKILHGRQGVLVAILQGLLGLGGRSGGRLGESARLLGLSCRLCCASRLYLSLCRLGPPRHRDKGLSSGVGALLRLCQPALDAGELVLVSGDRSLDPHGDGQGDLVRGDRPSHRRRPSRTSGSDCGPRWKPDDL